MEIYKILTGYAPLIMENFRENVYNIKNFQLELSKNINTLRYHLELYIKSTFSLGKSTYKHKTCSFID